MTDPTRPLPYPTSNPDGLWQTPSMTSPKAITAMGAISLPHIRVIPVIVIPGIMGTNLRAKTDPSQGRNLALRPGEAAWRPPNGIQEKYKELKKWEQRGPAQRQQILDPRTLEVDDSGEIDLSKMPTVAGFNDAMGRSRWWGEIHWESYGQLLYTLEHNLNATFLSLYSHGGRQLQPHWSAVNAWDRRDWNASSAGSTAPLTNTEFEKHAGFHFPVYACGYNWLLSNAESAKRLQQRVEDIIQYWSSHKSDCKQVILITHSMGGLVGRACAKNIPGKIAGIVHGVMPAMGAPVCYRRITYGTETSSPSKSWAGNKAMAGFAVIAGKTAAETTPVMATASGPLELLPNHLYREPWLFVTTKQEHAPDRDLLKLPVGNPYDMYRDLKSWYRLIDPALADPANTYAQKLIVTIRNAIDQAEKFHTKTLDTYYHPNTYVFYGNDFNQRSFGHCRWVCEVSPAGISLNDVKNATLTGTAPDGARNVTFVRNGAGHFQLSTQQDVAGDGTVPRDSGAEPSGKVRQIFATTGYDHQGSYSNGAMLALTQHLIVKIVQEVA